MYYTLYRGNHSDGCCGPGKGVALDVSNLLNHSACPVMDECAFDCSAWSYIKLAENKTLLCGVVYRSPNSNEANNQKLLRLMREAAAARSEQLLICGDFNLPSIDWSVYQSHEPENAFSSDFVKVVEDLALFQHARNPTRFRGTQTRAWILCLQTKSAWSMRF